MTISEKALIVNLKISQWTGRKFDKAATKVVADNFQTTKAVGNYNKKLLPGAAELEAIVRKSGSIRSYYYDQTLPWHNDGSRIISSKNYMTFAKEFGNQKADFDKLVAAFLANYDKLRVDAESRLGSLFNASDYPMRDRLEKAFSCEVAFFPVPMIQDFRTEVLESEKESFLKAMQDAEKTAMQDCYNRLMEVVGNAVDTLKRPDAIFRNSLVENISDLCQLLPRLNLTDDPKLESIRMEVESIVKATNVENCRKNSTARQSAAQSLDQVMSKMSAIMDGV